MSVLRDTTNLATCTRHSTTASRGTTLHAAAPRPAFLGNASSLRMADRRAVRPCSRSSVVVEANIFSRIARVGQSYVNAAINAAEDPEKMLDQTVNEMQEDLIKMRQAAAQVMASQKQLEMKHKQAQTTSDDWYRRAQLALQKGDEELAKEALKRRKSFQENADSLMAQFSSQREATDKLMSNTKLLESKLGEAKAKKDTLKARAQSAKSAKAVQEMVSGLGTSNALANFERMEEKVMKMEAEADATMMLSGGDALAQEFAMLEAGSVDDELEAMKKQLGGGTAETKKLPAAAKKADPIDEELEELRRKAKEL